jgi:menaquinone-dependent protoporphyrinogen oxidase
MMEEKILVTYASRTGTASGIAEVIGGSLSKNGFQVEVLPINEVRDLSIYNVIIIGSAIQGRQWLPEALNFIKENKDQLKKIKTAIFTVCITLSMKNGEKYLPEIRKWVLPVIEGINPIKEAYFAGKLDIAKIASLSDRMKFRLSVLFGIWDEGDHRDWATINTWIEELITVL